ncbi:MAG: DsrE family protein [Halothiobacillus sp.]|nr:DsrE family protein [Halothiobacillus sp.]
MKRLITASMLAFLGLFAFQGGAMAAANSMKHGVVYHLDSSDPGLEKATLRNINNHVNSPSGPTTQIELVIHGGGIKLLTAAKTDPQLQAAIDGLEMSGVKVKVCNNTLKSKKLDYKNDLYDVHASDIVPSGVAYLADKQFEGWAYIHP